MKILNDDQNPQTKLSSLFAMRQVTFDFLNGISSVSFSIKEFMDAYISGEIEVSPPAIQEAFQNYPEPAVEELNDINVRGQLGSFGARIISSGENIGKAFPRFFNAAASNGGIGEITRQFFEELRAQSPTTADDIVRDPLNNLGEFADSLSKLSPSLLIQMRLALENGDDTKLNQQLIDNVIDPAFDIAKNS